MTASDQLTTENAKSAPAQLLVERRFDENRRQPAEFANDRFYRVALHFARRIGSATVRISQHGIEKGNADGGYILACAHISHLDPFCIASVWPRKIGWMARMEFYRRAWAAALLNRLHAFPVNRQGVAVRAIREGLQRLGRGEVVGIFPEGEIKNGQESVLRGGAIKRGVCLLAARSGCPVLPCIVVGTEKLNRVRAWLPIRGQKLWIICGDFIAPISGPNRRAARKEMALEIENAFSRLYADLRDRWELDDSIVP